MPTCVQIETARLILKTVTMRDVQDVAFCWQLDDPPISLQEAESKVSWMLANHEQNTPGKIEHLCLAIIEKDSRQFIGWCGVDHRDRTRSSPVLFYLLKADFWGKGLATEAAQALLAFAFGELKVPRIDGGADFSNIASKRVMEKLGMTYLGLDEEGGYAFTISRDDFLGHEPTR